jgi:hypothetical protein
VTSSDVPLAERLYALLRQAHFRVVLGAPFIKLRPFQEALQVIPGSVKDVVVVTRWSAAEVAAGVSDPEIISAVEADGRGRVLLRHDLHAKLYVADEVCLVGSANLTGKALGTAANPNVELLVEMPSTDPHVAKVLTVLLHASQIATPGLATAVRAQADLLLEHGLVQPGVGSGESVGQSWYPSSRAPAHLYEVYSGRTAGKSTAALAAALADLQSLDLPFGLDGAVFRAAVAARLASLPEVVALDQAGEVSVRELEEALRQRPGVTDAADAAEALTRWLLYFHGGLRVERSADYRLVRGRDL